MRLPLKLPGIRRRFHALWLALFGLACVGGWSWSILNPTIGEAFVAVGVSKQSGNPVPLWTFGFVGDTHAGLADETLGTIFSRLAEAQPEFVLHLGDMVDVGAADAQWDDLTKSVHKHGLRLMPVVGNHDVHRGYSDDRGEIRWRQYFPQLAETFYSFRHRGLNFVMLNSERSLAAGTEQAKFLKKQLDELPGATFVCLHRPVFTCGNRDRAFLLARRLCLHSQLRESDVVCVLTGHNHYYERTRPLDGVTYLVSGGGSANQYGHESPNARTDCFVAGKSHYGLVDVHADHLAVRILDLEGEALDRFDLPLKTSSKSQLPPGGIAWGRELPPLATVRGSAKAETALQEAWSIAERAMPRLW